MGWRRKEGEGGGRRGGAVLIPAHNKDGDSDVRPPSSFLCFFSPFLSPPPAPVPQHISTPNTNTDPAPTPQRHTHNTIVPREARVLHNTNLAPIYKHTQHQKLDPPQQVGRNGNVTPDTRTWLCTILGQQGDSSFSYSSSSNLLSSSPFLLFHSQCRPCTVTRHPFNLLTMALSTPANTFYAVGTISAYLQ